MVLTGAPTSADARVALLGMAGKQLRWIVLKRGARGSELWAAGLGTILEQDGFRVGSQASVF